MRRNKKWLARSLAGAMSASMVVSLSPVTAFAVTGDQVAKDGTYTGTAHVSDGDGDGWSEYDVTVKLTVTDGVFSNIEVIPGNTYEPDGEYGSKTYFNWAVEANTAKRVGIKTKLTGMPATQDTVNSWDTVSSATYTSQAIKNAALEALQGAETVEKEPEPVPSIDTVLLENVITEAEGKSEIEYTAESWAVMQTALTSAKAVLAAPESQEIVNEAAEALTDAIAALVPAGNEKEDVEYVLMNIPYADFYAAELAENTVPVDAVASATLNKTRTDNLVAGSYHVNSDGTDISGITFPVKVNDGVDLSGYKEVTDEDSVSITVTNRGNTSTKTYSGQETLFENSNYAYYVLKEAPAYYKEVSVVNGKLTFGKTVGDVTTVNDVTADLTTETTYGDYQLSLNGLNVDTSKVYAVVIGTEEGAEYGLRHLENVWRGTELAWCTGFTTAVHNCPTSSAHYAAMMGQHIDEVTYYTGNGIYKIPVGSIYVPEKFDGSAEVADALVSDGSTTVSLNNVPDDYQAEYSVEGLDDVSVKDGVLSFSKDAQIGVYTLTVKDAGGKYADITAKFTLLTDAMPAVYNNDNENPALVKDDGYEQEEFDKYIKAISSVSVNGKSYPASGRGAVTIIKEDGTLDTAAAPFAEGDSFEIKVSATGFRDLTFTYGEEAEYKYVYAGLTWAEYWAAENVQAAGDASSSEAVDKKGEYDKGAFDTVSRATTNHGLHRGSFQCSAVIYMKDGTTYEVSYYTGATTAVLTNGQTVEYNKADIDHYVVTGLKYVPVKVAAADYEAFCEKYTVVENGEALAGGFSEQQLANYTDVIADVTENTNGLKTAVKDADGNFSFSARTAGNESGIKDTALKTASGIEPEVREANGSYGEFLRVDLNGAYGDLAANMQTVTWTYYGNDSSYGNPLATYGTKFAADNWMHKSMGIQLGLTDSLRCTLPEGTDGTGYWTLTVHALGYEDYTYAFEATNENIVKDDPVTDTSALEKAIADAEALKESDYTPESWSNMQTELQEAKEELEAKHSQSAVQEATEHLTAAINALEKVPEDNKVDTSALEAAVNAAKELKESDYTADSWSVFEKALTDAQKVLEDPQSQDAVDQAVTVLANAQKNLVKKQNPIDPDDKEPTPTPTVTPDDKEPTPTPTVTPDDKEPTPTVTPSVTKTQGTGTVSGTNTSASSNKTSGSVSKSGTAKTGDVTNIFGWMSTAIAALGAGGVSLKMKGRKKK